jgi:hypothetical protein
LAAQKGDKAAGDALVRNHAPWIRANLPRWSDDYEDRLQAAFLALWRAVLNWKPGKGGLNAYYRPYFDGAMSEFNRKARNSAGFGSSRIQRYLGTKRRWEHTAEQIGLDYPRWHLRQYGELPSRCWSRRDIEEELALCGRLISPAVSLADHYNHHAHLSGSVRLGDDPSNVTSINGKPQPTSDGVHRHRTEQFPDAISDFTRRATSVRWLLGELPGDHSLKTEQWRRPYPLKVKQRPALVLQFPILWLREAPWPPYGLVDDTDVRGLGEGASSVLSGAISPLLPIPQGQAPAISSTWNSDSLPKIYRSNRSLNILPETQEAFANLKKSHSWPLEIKHGLHDNARRTIHRDHVGDGRRRRRASG